MNNEVPKNKVPKFVDNAFNNIEDILKAMTDEGLINLDFNARDMDKVKITQLGVQITLKNREGKDFKVFVCPDSYDDKKIKETIMNMGLAIAEQYKKIH
jgi:hypothetical protein